MRSLPDCVACFHCQAPVLTLVFASNLMNIVDDLSTKEHEKKTH